MWAPAIRTIAWNRLPEYTSLDIEYLRSKIRLMTYVQKVRRGMRNPQLLFRLVNRQYHRFITPGRYNDGTGIFDLDWDNLLLLDACRYDVFSEYSDLPGKLDSRFTLASNTLEFLEANMTQEEFFDTIYITANPQLYRFSESIEASFYREFHLWNGEEWDSKWGTVHPDVVTKRAKSIAEQFPHKRLIIHYLQPHYPFVGDRFDPSVFGVDEETNMDFWLKQMTGETDFTADRVWAGYIDNLKYVLPLLDELLETLRGKSIVTSDHGNMFGERSHPLPIAEWGHPPGIYTEELTKVPLLAYQNGPRRKIKIGESDVTHDHVEETSVSERLRDLGYVA